MWLILGFFKLVSWGRLHVLDTKWEIHETVLKGNVTEHLIHWSVAAAIPHLLFFLYTIQSCVTTNQLLCNLGDQVPLQCWWGGAAHMLALKCQYSCELNILYSCRCLVWGIVGTEIKWMQMRYDGRHPFRWWQHMHTSSDDCTINHPCVNALVLIIRPPITHRNLQPEW